MKLAIICAPNGVFSSDGASAVMLNIRDAVCFSRFRDDIVVIGPKVAEPFEGVRFRGVRWQGGVSNYVAAVQAILDEEQPDVLELRQHLRMAEKLAKQNPRVPSLLFRHQQLKSAQEPVRPLLPHPSACPLHPHCFRFQVCGAGCFRKIILLSGIVGW